MQLLKTGKPIRGRDLRAQFDSLGPQAFYGHFMEAVNEGLITLEQFSIRDLAESFLGDSWNRSFRDVAQGGVALMEAGTPVGSTAFRNITGQLIFSTIRRWFQNEAFVFSALVPTILSRIEGTEKVPSIARIGDASEIVIEGQDYPTVGFGEEYFTWAAKDKRGLIVDLTEEAIFYDLTNLVLEAAREVGLWLGTKKEKLIIDAFVGATASNNYSRNGTATNTYLTTGAYVNDATGVALNDWTSIDAAELMFNDVLDPNTSEPIELMDGETTLVCMPYKKHTARRIVSATEVRERSETGASTRENEMVSANPIANYKVVTSKLLYRRVLAGPEAVAANAREWWWLGAINRAFAWVENFPLRVFQQTDGDRAFEADIVARFKASMKGVAQVVEPRYMQRRRNG